MTFGEEVDEDTIALKVDGVSKQKTTDFTVLKNTRILFKVRNYFNKFTTTGSTFG